MQNKKYFLPKLLAGLLVLTYLIIVLGGATRVFEAGMSCPDWPTCYGVWLPYPESVLPNGYVVDNHHYQAYQVALEWFHRLFAAIAGIVLLVALVMSIKTRKGWKQGVLASIVLLVQIKLGGVTVWFDNIPWSVAIHLGTAMFFFAAVLWWRRAVVLPEAYEKPQITKTTKTFFILNAVLVWLTMAVGATVSSAYAGGVCGGLFDCAGSWMPADPLQHLHMGHRFLAVFVFALSIVLMVLGKKSGFSFLRHTARGLHILVLGQVVLGILTLYSFASFPQFYQILSVLHLAWGTLVWMGAMGAVMSLRYGKAGAFHG